MPKYLALNYVSMALQQSRTLLERMVLPPPRHLDFVETYVHQGDQSDNTYASPWLQEYYQNANKDMSLVGVEELSLNEELNELISSLSITHGKMEEFDIEKEKYRDDDSDNDLFTEEIDIVFNRMENDKEHYIHEEFTQIILHPWYLNVHEEYVVDLLELPESPAHLPMLLHAMPGALDLSCRLKPKLVSDPFLDETGDVYSCDRIMKHDFNPVNSVPVTRTLRTHKELFTREVCQDCEEILLELPLSPMDTHNPSPPILAVTSSLILEKEEEEREDSLSDVKMLIKDHNIHLSQLEISNCVVKECEKKSVSFLDLNNTGLEDSGIGNMLLESPCISDLESPCNNHIKSQITQLESYPLSPDKESITILNSNEEKMLLNKLLKQDKLFDNIAALILLYPEVETLENVILSVNVLIEVWNIVHLQCEDINGDIELSLPWDPVESIHKEMKIALRNLVNVNYTEKENRVETNTRTHGMEKERFKSDLNVFEWINGADPPVYITTIMCASHQHIPTMEDRNTNFSSTIVSSTITSPTITSSKHASPTITSVTERLPSILSTVHTPSVPSNDSTMPGLDTFLMLRAVSNRRNGKIIERETQTGNPILMDNTKNDMNHSVLDISSDDLVLLEVEEPVKPVLPVTIEVPLSGEYKQLLFIINTHAGPYLPLLRECGLNVIHDDITDISLDSLKFIMKQQQIEESRTNDYKQKNGAIYRSVVELYILGCVADVIKNCSFLAALSKLSTLCQRFESLLDGKLNTLQQVLFQYQNHHLNLPHPKLNELLIRVNYWNQTRQQEGSEKCVIIVCREFSALSSEISELLQAISGLSSCVFSFNEEDSHLYQKDWFQHYQCLVVPESSVTFPNFPWEQVSLVIEYETIKNAIFSNELPNQLKEYIILQTVKETTVNNIDEAVPNIINGITYSLIVSDTVTSNIDLLELLETRYNFVVIERDYCAINKRSKSNLKLSSADITLDPSSCVVIRPLQLLSTENGLRTLVNTVSMLSLQYEQCWVLLYSTDSKIYHFGGDIPTNLAYLHASLAHHTKKTGYTVHVTCNFSFDEVAEIVRRLAEWKHQQIPTEWNNRDWIVEDISKQELFLMSMQCINSMSAQYMLKSNTLGELFITPLEELERCFPLVPTRSLQIFRRLCTLGNPIQFTDYQMQSNSYTLQENTSPVIELPTSSGDWSSTDRPVDANGLFTDSGAELFEEQQNGTNIELFNDINRSRSYASIHNYARPSMIDESECDILYDKTCHSKANTLFDNISCFNSIEDISTSDASTSKLHFGYRPQSHSGLSIQNKQSTNDFNCYEETQRPSALMNLHQHTKNQPIVSNSVTEGSSVVDSELVSSLNKPVDTLITTTTSRKPMKSLDLGFVSSRTLSTPLRVNDRALVSCVRLPEKTKRYLDAVQQNIPHSSVNNYYDSKSCTRTRNAYIAPNLNSANGLPVCIPYGRATRGGGGTAQKVPIFSPTTEIDSFYQSTLSSLHHETNGSCNKRRKLSCEKVPGNTDGQTRLTFSRL